MNKITPSGSKRPLIVYVLLGDNLAPTLLDFASSASNYLPEAELVLLTNRPLNWAKFPGKVIALSPEFRLNVILNIEKKFPQKVEQAGRYWIYTLERLFVLGLLKLYFENSRPVIHFESDVLSFVDYSTYQLLLTNCSKVSIPRYSPIDGIASILFAPTIQVLSDTLDLMALTLDKSDKWISDMNLLGIALNSHLLQELPIDFARPWPINALSPGTYKKQFLIFDGSALGQYLFGLDPVHTGGQAISGYVNQFYSQSLSTVTWKISTIDDHKKNMVLISFNECDYFVANLHVHAKIPLEALHPNSSQWNRFIDEANGTLKRLPHHFSEDVIWSKPITLRNRYRLAKENGTKWMITQAILVILRKRNFKTKQI